MDPQFRQPATVSKEEETHSGEDVGVYASGPYSHVDKHQYVFLVLFLKLILSSDF